MITKQLIFSFSKFNQCDVWLNSRYDFDFIDFENFQEWFNSSGDLIHQDRNTLKLFHLADNCELPSGIVIKSFKVPNFANRVIYSFFRLSKARRSLYNSASIKSLGFSVPEPLFCIHFKTSGLLTRSYYASENILYQCTMHEVYRQKMFDWREVLPLVIEQAFLMHQEGIFHKDFSPGNILISKNDNGFLFSFVDLNRVEFGSVSFHKGLSGFIRLVRDDESVELIARTYADLSGVEFDIAESLFEKAIKKHRRFQSIKKQIKKVFSIK